MSNLDIVLKSIDLLKEDMKPDWGKMSCSQMVKHCNRFIQVYVNEVKFKPPISLLSPIFGKLHIFWLKYILTAFMFFIAFRIVFFLIYSPQKEIPSFTYVQAIILGIRFDATSIAYLLLPIWIIVCISSL